PVAAATLATGAATWTVTALGRVLVVGIAFLGFLVLLQDFLVGRLLCAWLALFTRRTRLALGAFLAHGLGVLFDFVEWCAQFALALFPWLALFAWCALAAWLWRAVAGGFLGFARLAWFTLFTWRARLTLFPWLTLFARCALFPRLALFVAGTARVTAAILLATAAALIVALWAIARRLLLLNFEGGFFLLPGKQTDQGFDQAFEQAWLLSCC